MSDERSEGERRAPYDPMPHGPAEVGVGPWQGPWPTGEEYDAQLLADIAEGFDVLVVGADKWWQLHDVRFYGSEAAMHTALGRLPELAVAPRAGVPAPPGVDLLDVDAGMLPFMTANQAGMVRFILVGIGLMLLVVFMPQGIMGNKKEMTFVK